MRAFFIVPSALMLSASGALASPCPATVTADEKAAGSAAGAASVEHKFRYVSFFDGDPKDQADLAPDDAGPNPTKLRQSWELMRSAGRPITMVCRYHDTDKTFVDAVPLSIKSCTLTGEMDAQGNVIGSPTLECK